MKFKTLALLSLLIVFVVACKSTGDFCLSASQLPIKSETVDYIVENDIDFARGVASHNSFGATECGWEPFNGS